MSGIRISGPGIDIFICGRGLSEKCHACPASARTRCAVCKKGLCQTHERKKDGEPRCATHAPMTENPNMPKPPGRR